MRKLDQRGMAALEFALLAVPFFVLTLAIIDFGRYAITVQSLRTLANAGARATMLQCYSAAAIAKTSPSGCTAVNTYLPDAQKQNAAPFLYVGGLTPTLSAAAGAAALTVTASQPGFAMIVPVWGTALNAPSASTSLPF
jgi:Flp pilus assembly protein TadG